MSDFTFPCPSITDAERLDFLTKLFESKPYEVVQFRHYGPGAAGCEAFSCATQHVRGYSIRGAIDAMILADAIRNGKR